jgi:Protein of unknown function (DUF1501)
MSQHMNSIQTDFARRAFMERFAKASFGVSLFSWPSGLNASEHKVGGKATSVIFLYMRGGISHIDTFDPKPGQPEMGGVRAISTSADGVQISEWFPSMAKQAHHLTLVRSMTSTQGIHERGTYLAHTSYFMTPTITHPSLGSWAVKLLGSSNQVLPGNILINGSPQHPRSGYMPTHLAPLPIVDPGSGLQNAVLPSKVSESEFARRIALAQSMGDRFLQRTPHRDAAAYLKVQQDATALMKSQDLKVFDISGEDSKTQAAYGTTTFGKGCLLARRLVESGVRYIEVEDEHNWDTHNDQIKSMEIMTPSTDKTMAALLDDLHQRGLLESTLVVMATEFGRTPEISSVTAGRGHHPSVFTWWLAGGGVKGGYVHGKSDATGERVEEKPVTMPDLNATIAHAMGIDLQHIVQSPSGRPFTVADKGAPVLELFA